MSSIATTDLPIVAPFVSEANTLRAFAILSIREIETLLAVAKADALRIHGDTENYHCIPVRIEVLKGKKNRSARDGSQQVRRLCVEHEGRTRDLAVLAYTTPRNS